MIIPLAPAQVEQRVPGRFGNLVLAGHQPDLAGLGRCLVARKDRQSAAVKPAVDGAEAPRHAPDRTGQGIPSRVVAMEIRGFNPGERERAERYLLLDEEQLYPLIPPYLTEYDHTRFSPDGQREAGRTWFEAIRGSLEQKLCDEWRMCRTIGRPEFADAAALVVVIGDAIATTVAGVPPVLVATIIVRMGVRRFCDCP